MFGIGLPELILIMAVALIVVGPEKLPELAKTLARQIVELKKAANALKNSLNEEEGERPWERIAEDRPRVEFTPVRPVDGAEEPGGTEVKDGAPADNGEAPPEEPEPKS